jgi:signal transduction histidine kinase
MSPKIGLKRRKVRTKARLILQKKFAEPVIFQLGKFPVTLGRKSTNDIVLNDKSVSREHARIILSSGQIVVEDLGSANGTFLNGVRVSSSALTNGDALHLGGCMFRVEIGDSKASTIAISTSDWDLSSHSISPDDLTAEAKDRTLYAPGGPVTHVLAFFQQTGKILESAFELDDILRKILDLSFQMIPAERGFVLLADPDSGEMAVRAQKFREDEANRDGKDANLSKTILDYATKEGRAILTTDATHDDRFGTAKSVINQDIRGAICVPLKGREEILGAIYVDSKVLSQKFSLDDLKLLTSVGVQLGIAVENARLYESKLRTEKLAAVGQAVAGLGHCIKNILNGMQGGSFIVEKGLGKDDRTAVHKGWDILKRSSSKLKDLVLDMLTYSKPREPTYERVKANRVPAEVVELFKEKAAARGVELIFEPDETLDEVVIDSKAIYRVVLNLVINAVEACPSQGGKVQVKTFLLPGDKSYQIIVSDNGCGIVPEDLSKLGKTFFSTKGSQGTGLGLCVSYKIVAEHKGNIDVISQSGEGTAFTVTLPVKGPDSQ